MLWCQLKIWFWTRISFCLFRSVPTGVLSCRKRWRLWFRMVRFIAFLFHKRQWNICCCSSLLRNISSLKANSESLPGEPLSMNPSLRFMLIDRLRKRNVDLHNVRKSFKLNFASIVSAERHWLIRRGKDVLLPGRTRHAVAQPILVSGLGGFITGYCLTCLHCSFGHGYHGFLWNRPRQLSYPFRAFRSSLPVFPSCLKLHSFAPWFLRLDTSLSLLWSLASALRVFKSTYSVFESVHLSVLTFIV